MDKGEPEGMAKKIVRAMKERNVPISFDAARLLMATASEILREMAQEPPSTAQMEEASEQQVSRLAAAVVSMGIGGATETRTMGAGGLRLDTSKLREAGLLEPTQQDWGLPSTSADRRGIEGPRPAKTSAQPIEGSFGAASLAAPSNQGLLSRPAPLSATGAAELAKLTDQPPLIRSEIPRPIGQPQQDQEPDQQQQQQQEQERDAPPARNISDMWERVEYLLLEAQRLGDECEQAERAAFRAAARFEKDVGADLAETFLAGWKVPIQDRREELQQLASWRAERRRRRRQTAEELARVEAMNEEIQRKQRELQEAKNAAAAELRRKERELAEAKNEASFAQHRLRAQQAYREKYPKEKRCFICNYPGVSYRHCPNKRDHWQYQNQ